MKNKNNSLNAILQSSTLIVVIVFSVWLAMGFGFDLSGINKKFFVKVAINLTVSILCYNMVFGMYFGNLARNENCRYYITVATKKLRIERIYSEKRNDDLKTAIDLQNIIDLDEFKDYKIRRVCARLSYDDIKDLKESTLTAKLKEYKDLYALSNFTLWRLKRVIRSILSGKVKIDKLKPSDILIDNESHKLKQNRLKTYAAKRAVKRNIKKSLKTLIQAAVLAILSFSPSGVGFLQTLINQLSLFLMAATAGLLAAAQESKYITDVYDSHNKFILQNLDIDDKYKPTEN